MGEFHTAFHGHHTSVDLMRRKQQELLDLKQQTNNVYEYCKKFNYLARYSAHHMDTDEKMVELFRNGLSMQL
jgi:hypothetical protein